MVFVGKIVVFERKQWLVGKWDFVKQWSISMREILDCSRIGDNSKSRLTILPKMILILAP